MKKNTMKKVIVPAMGLLLLSAAASTTGTVAWFVANRTVSASVTNIVACNPEKGIVYLATAGINTTAGTTYQDKSKTSVADNDRNNAVNITKNLRDASANYAGSGTTAQMYKGIITENASTGVSEVVSYGALATDGSDAAYNTSASIYYYASWTMTFEMKDKSGDDNSNSLFFNESSKLAFTDDASGKTKDIAKAFRILLIGANGNYVVWAPNSGSTTDTHVTSTTGTGTWTADNVANTVAAGSRIVASTTTATEGKTADNHYLGEIASNSSLTVYCYAYFEGCDDDCVAEAKNIGVAMTSTLDFYAIDAAQWKVGA